MFKQTAKTKGKTVKTVVPGSKRKGVKSPAAHPRGFVAPQKGVQSPPQISQDSIDEDPDELTGSESAEGRVQPGELEEEHENDGGPCIENCESIADAVKTIQAKRKGPKKYDGGTNTYR